MENTLQATQEKKFKTMEGKFGVMEEECGVVEGEFGMVKSAQQATQQDIGKLHKRLEKCS